ncbi:hypothetical protein [Micromonospora thermarum]|uniref:Gram-positive cocci surface proteins LPxTG domain-containing protein n=1 Tax=Micromonospora thermarum TaxID=2720024 RepID=A0ABX0ZEY0_9ACTN|nr:hypothetical protein [Micromonospora thermarum]NJP34626.1 hypothetical protein [Micromonospora thermarum]
MSFLTKLAGGVVLGSAALLLAAPATALAATDDGSKDRKTSDRGHESDRKSDDKPKTFDLKDKKGNGVICATTKQINEQNINQIIKDNTIEDSVVTFNLNAAQSATNDNRTQPNTIVVCIRDLDVAVDVEADLLGDLLRMVEAASPAGQRAGTTAGTTAAPGGAYAGPEGAFVLPKTAGVAAGDGGAFSDTDTGALTAAGAGLMGVGVLGGIALLRRRSANGTAA